MKKAHEYWYYFGKRVPRPVQIRKGMIPAWPYKKFDTKEDCQKWIDENKTPNLNENELVRKTA